MGLYCPLSNLWYAALDTTDFQVCIKTFENLFKSLSSVVFQEKCRFGMTQGLPVRNDNTSDVKSYVL